MNLGRILRDVVISGAAILLLFPIGKYLHNCATHNYSRVTELSETHAFSGGIDTYFQYSKFRDGAEQIRAYPGSLDLAARFRSLPFKSLDMRTYDKGDQIQEIRIIRCKLKVNGLRTIKYRDRDYRDCLESFNCGDELLALARQRAEARKLNGDVNQQDKPIFFNF